MLTPEEMADIRYHLGYPSVEPAASIQLGIPRVSETQFLLETAMTKVLPQSLSRVRSVLSQLNCIEQQISNARTRLKAIAVGNIKLNNSEADNLEHEHARWAARMADLLGCPLYPFALRNAEVSNSVAAGNLRVVRR